MAFPLHSFFKRVLTGTLLLLSNYSWAQELDWLPIPYVYVAKGESLRDLLIDFSANYDATVVVSDKINDKVSGQFEHDNPQDFLQHIASLYNLVWYYDGNVLYIFKNSEVASRLIRLQESEAAELKLALQRSLVLAGALMLATALFTSLVLLVILNWLNRPQPHWNNRRKFAVKKQGH